MALSKNLTAGPILVGVLISTFLYGISTLQTYNYSRVYAKDPLWLRCVVWGVWVLETVLTVLTCAYQYSISVTNFGNYGVYNDLPWTIAITFFLSGFIGGIVQSFFAWRIFVISGHWWTSLPPWLGSLARVGVVIAMCTFTLQTHSRSVYEDRYGWTIDLALSLALFTDAWNTICLCYYLHTRRSKHRKMLAIDTIMRWTIETGLATSICQIITLAINVAQRDDTIWLGNIFFYPRLYSNALMMSLNGRAALQETSEFHITTSAGLGASRGYPGPIAVNVSRNTEVQFEMSTMRVRPGELDTVADDLDEKHEVPCP